MNFSQIFKASVAKAQHIIITTHTHPDADGIGSQLGLCLALRKFNKNALCVNEEALPSRYAYLDKHSLIQSVEHFNSKGKNAEADLLIVVDTNTTERVGSNVQKLISNKTKIIYIDHHPYNHFLEPGHLIDPTAAATGQLVAELMNALEIEIDAQMAIPLYTAILIDTNSFRYTTVTSRTHQVVAQLLKTGINPAGAYNKIYGTKTIEHTHFLGEVLKNSDTNSKREIAWIHITQEVQDKYGISAEDSNAFINHLLVLDNMKVACMFREDDGHIKLSLRSHGIIDVGEIANSLGGGGHSHAAATRLELPNNPTEVEQIIKDTIQKIESLLASR